MRKYYTLKIEGLEESIKLTYKKQFNKKYMLKKHKDTFIFFISIAVIIIVSITIISSLKIIGIYITSNNTEVKTTKENDDGIEINYTKPLKDPLIIPAPR